MPCSFIIALVKSQYTRANARLPLLFVGITISRNFSSLLVSHNPTTGIPMFFASCNACVSASGSVTIKSSGSRNPLELGFVSVPGLKRPSKTFIPVYSDNFLMGFCPY